MIKLILYVFLGLNLASPSFQTLTTFIANQFYTSCSDPTNTLPNLQYAKRPTVIVSSDVTCSGGYTDPAIFTIMWYYYSTPPSPGQCVAHDTATSKINFTINYFQDQGGSTIGTRIGTVIEGAFLGQRATYVATTVNLNVDVCQSDIGLEARSGTAVLTLTNPYLLCGVPLFPPCGGTPTCSGVYTLEFCPGLRGNIGV